MITVLERLTAAGYSEGNARAAVASGRVHVDDLQVVDPDVTVVDGARVIEMLSA